MIPGPLCRHCGEPETKHMPAHIRGGLRECMPRARTFYEPPLSAPEALAGLMDAALAEAFKMGRAHQWQNDYPRPARAALAARLAEADAEARDWFAHYTRACDELAEANTARVAAEQERDTAVAALKKLAAPWGPLAVKSRGEFASDALEAIAAARVAAEQERDCLTAPNGDCVEASHCMHALPSLTAEE